MHRALAEAELHVDLLLLLLCGARTSFSGTPSTRRSSQTFSTV